MHDLEYMQVVNRCRERNAAIVRAVFQKKLTKNKSKSSEGNEEECAREISLPPCHSRNIVSFEKIPEADAHSFRR